MKLVTPISELFGDIQTGKALASMSDGLEARPDLDEPAISGWPTQTTHVHFSAQDMDVHTEWGLRQKATIRNALNAIGAEKLTLSFHLSRDFIVPETGRNGRFHPSGQRLTLDEMRRNCDRNTTWLRKIGPHTILFENNNFYNSGAYDIVCDPRNIRSMVSDFADGLLLDFAHGMVSAGNLGIPESEYFGPLLECKVRQIHLSRPRQIGGEFVDCHELPDSSLVRHCERLIGEEIFDWPPTTIEYYKSGESLLLFVRELRARDGAE